jgi:signal transduction histidine kinase
MSSKRLLDMLMTAVVLALMVTFVVVCRIQDIGPNGTHTAHGPLVAGLLLAALAALPLLFWRRQPVAVFIATLLGSASLMALDYAGGPPIGATVALFLLARSRTTAEPWSLRLTALVAALFVVHFTAFGLAHDQFPLVQLAPAALVWAVAWFLGERVRMRQAALAGLRQRALRAEREAEQDRRLAVAEERTRIARDLHDSAAHAINVIAVQAGAARLHLGGDSDRSRAALETIEAVARQTVTEIDQIVHGLRSPEGVDDGVDGVEPPGGLASLETLVRRSRTAERPVQLEITGQQRSLRPSIDRAAYRIVQEALTNADRHGAGETSLAVAFRERELELTVVNRAPGATAPRAGGGHGLVGMRERVTMLGGSMSAEHRGEEFLVHALLPYGAST